jgi:hypothetical protein
MATMVTNEPGVLQMGSLLRDGFTTHTQHVGDKLLRHDEFVGRQAIVAEKQPTTKLLLHGMKPVADGRLRYLGD